MNLRNGVFWVLSLVPSLAAQQQQTAQIRGRILDLDGNPLAGASVQVVGSKIPAVISDSEGRFQLTDMAPGSGSLEVNSGGFMREFVSYNLSSGDRIALDIGLLVGFTAPTVRLRINGTIRDSKGAPVQGARVRFQAYYNARVSVAASTDGAGRYTLSLTYPGQYEISAASPDGEVCIVETRYWSLTGARKVDLMLHRSAPL